MSVKLQQAFAEEKVVVRKRVSGEVMVKFHSSLNLADLVLSSSKEMDLLSRKGITVDALKKSNLKDLVSRQYLELV